jgi:hypothetical protein
VATLFWCKIKKINPKKEKEKRFLIARFPKNKNH